LLGRSALVRPRGLPRLPLDDRASVSPPRAALRSHHPPPHPTFSRSCHQAHASGNNRQKRKTATAASRNDGLLPPHWPTLASSSTLCHCAARSDRQRRCHTGRNDDLLPPPSTSVSSSTPRRSLGSTLPRTGSTVSSLYIGALNRSPALACRNNAWPTLASENDARLSSPAKMPPCPHASSNNGVVPSTKNSYVLSPVPLGLGNFNVAKP
jgi:hypothetical protein